ncbi:condensation domain-containing protein, partial [Streptomyces sp. NRRL S-813]|uniref:condensation domain-containing protein n=1 Tax=Streptomyces sp. NRRL S-813 TaxID=1463919 RepID=UPI0004C25074
MNIDELLLRALRAGVTLAVDHDRLTFQAPNGLSGDLRALLVSHRDELIATLSSENLSTPTPITRSAEQWDGQGEQDASHLSSGQERLWLIEQRLGPSSLHHIHLRMRWRGRLNTAAFRAAVRALTSRHHALRTVFPLFDGLPRTAVRPVTDPESIDVTHLDVRERAPGTESEAVAAFLGSQQRTPFDLAAGPLTRWGIVSFGDDEHVVALTQHHLITDGWSIALVLSDLLKAYEAELRGGEAPGSAPSVRYADYVRWEQARRGHADYAQQVEWWSQHLAGLRPLNLPRDRGTAPQAGDHSGATVSFQVSSEVTASLEQLARRLDTTLYTVLLTAWAVILHRVTGQDNFAVGTVTSGRDQAELHDVVGFFANTVVLRCDLSGNPDVREVIRRLRTETTEAFNHSVPFGDVVTAVGGVTEGSLTPLIQAAFVFENLPAVTYGDGSEIPGVDSLVTEARVDGSVEGTAKFDLSLILGRHTDGLDGLLEYASAQFSPGLVAGLRDQLLMLLTRLAVEPSTTVDTPRGTGDHDRERVPTSPQPFPAPPATGPGMPASCCDRPADHATFFRTMLGDVAEPCAPYGLLDVQGDGADVVEAR